MGDPTRRLSARLSVLWLVIGAITVIGVYAALIWAIPRGFDSSDEAWMYGLIASNRVAVGEAWGFQHVLHPLFVATGQSVLVFRFIRLLGYFFVSAFLLVVALKASKAFGITLRPGQWVFILIVSQVGTFLAWSFPPRNLGYNELSSWLSQVGASLIVLLVVSRVVDHPIISTRWLWILWAGLGTIALFLLAIKITTGIVFGLIVVAALFVRNTQMSFIRRLLAGIAGLIVAFLLLLATGFPFAPYVRNLLSLVFDKSARSAYDHPLDALLTTYGASLDDAFKVLLSSILLFVVLIVLLLVLLVPRLDPAIARVVRVAAAIITALASLSLFWWPYIGMTFTYLGYFSLFLGVAVLVVFALWLALRLRGGISPPASSRRIKWAVSFAVIVVIATPFAGAVGTNNGLTGQLLYSVTIWMIALAFFLVLLSDRLARSGHHLLSSAPSIFLICLVALSAGAVRGDILNHPYRIAPYAQQQSSTNAPYLSGVRLIRPEAELFDWMAKEGKELHAANVPTIAISSPGGLLAFNANGFASPWVDTFWPVSFRSIEAACAAGAPSEMFVLQAGAAKANSDVVTETRKALDRCHVSFPADFVIVAQHSSDDADYSMKIWKLKPAR